MSSVQHLSEFIRERLAAAAQEIFTQVEKTIISYEKELDAQRRMTGIDWKPQIKLHRVGSELQRRSSDLQQPRVSNEAEDPVIQHVWSLASRSSENKKKAEHQWTEDVQMEPEPKLIKTEEKEPEPKLIKTEEKEPEPKLIEKEPEPTLIKCEEIEYPLTYVRKEELDSSVLQHEQQPPEHLPTGQNQKDLCSSQEGEQLVQKQVVALMDTSTLQEDNMSEEETRAGQLPLHVSSVVESKNQEGSSCSVSKSQSDTDTKKRPFTCNICGICYPAQWKLKKHFKTHTGEQPISCEICRKSFYKSDDIFVNKTGKRPVLCKSCRKRFSFLFDAHKESHMKKKPSSCDMRKETFSCKSCKNVSYKLSHENSYKSGASLKLNL